MNNIGNTIHIDILGAYMQYLYRDVQDRPYPFSIFFPPLLPSFTRL